MISYLPQVNHIQVYIFINAENPACSLGVFVSERFLMTLKLQKLRQVQNKPLSERATRSRCHNYLYASLVYSGLL